MIIDCHTHLNNYDPNHPDSLADRIARIEAAMARSGTDHAIVLTSFMQGPDRPSTREVVAALEGNPRLSVVAGVSFQNYKQRDLWELADFLEAGRIRGLKLYPGYEPFYPHDPRMRVVYELAGEYEVPVMIHTGDRPELLGETAEDGILLGAVDAVDRPEDLVEEGLDLLRWERVGEIRGLDRLVVEDEADGAPPGMQEERRRAEGEAKG